MLKQGKSLIEVPPSNDAEEEQLSKVAARMEALYDEFAAWDVTTDALGCLKRAKSVLSLSAANVRAPLEASPTLIGT